MYPDWHGTVNYIRVLPFHLPAKAFTQVLHRPAWEFRREPHPAAKAGGHAGRLPADAANRSHPTCGRQRHDGLAKPRPNRGTLSFNGSRTAAAWEAAGPLGCLMRRVCRVGSTLELDGRLVVHLRWRRGAVQRLLGRREGSVAGRFRARIWGGRDHGN